jgi:hypothetical protein
MPRKLITVGTTILEEPKPVPTGINMRIRHPEGLIVKYDEHKQSHRPHYSYKRKKYEINENKIE